ncbi:unnamed protein product [Rotaria sordida]|uniref:Uncharacterized protein n=1 Tax=Rotaria sordida TaxID=392033 RepID=A0A815QW52_9BILA|nr:unnamed protein product [Rotaria sordida]
MYLQSRCSITSTTSLLPPPISTVSKIIFIIDDIHFADESSLKHLLTLGSHSKCLLILSMKPPRNNHNDGSISTTLQSISTDSHVYLRRLPGLELRYLATLGCQILSVHRIPAKLVKVFNESCNGIPGFCEQILFDLLSKDKIYIVDEENNNSYNDDSSLIEGDADKLLLNSQIRMGLFKTFFSRRRQQITNEQYQNERAFSRICLLRNPIENDFNADCQQNFQNYIMCRIDRLSEGESLLVKIATVIGNTFSRTFLWHLVDPKSKQLINIHSCILEMMQRTIIECAFSKQQITKTRSIKCYCLQNPAGFPSQCRLMAFTHSTIREGIYNSLTDGLKRLLTRNAIDYLEKQCNVVCLTCAANKNDSPFLVDEHNGLTKIIKISQQHAFVDIVKMAALKEIDNTIKKLSNLNDSPRYSRSKRLSHAVHESDTELNENEMINENKSFNNDYDKRRISLDDNNIESLPPKITSARFYSVENDNLINENVIDLNTPGFSHRYSNDPNITLISVYSPNMSSNIEFNVQKSSSSRITNPSQLISLFKVPKQRNINKSISNTQLLKTVDGVVSNNNSNQTKPGVEIPKRKVQNKNNRFISFFQYLFCQCVPIGSNATVAPAINNNNQTKDSNNDLNQISTNTQVDNYPKENMALNKNSSNWKKVCKAVLPSLGKSLRTIPSEDELLERSLFSSQLMEQITNDINCLNKQIYLTRTFKTLYDQSLTFTIFQSYFQRNNLIQYIYEIKHNEEHNPDLNQFVNEFHSYSDLRICECIDHVMSVYIKLVEYYTNLYDIYEKMVDDKRDHLRLKQFDRVMHYRIEICQLLLRCNCLQRLLVEITNAKKFIEKFQNDTKNQEDFIYEYQFLITKYTYDLFQAIVLQRTRAIRDSKQLCEQNLRELNQAYQNQIWEKLISCTESSSLSSANEKRKLFEHSKIEDSKDSSLDCNSNSQSSTASNSDPLCLFDGKYRLEYLLCQYNLLKYDLSRQQSIDSINTLIELQYYTFPLSFSLPCTIMLVEYFYCRMNYTQCLTLIDKIIRFWWSYTNPHEKVEFAKLKCLSLIIELKQGSLNSAILSGYFAKRILTGYHENIFLIQSCIHLTLALIGEMRISNVELILQHLEYLSEQTMDCYAKLWYYTLVIDIAIELGYELLPITNDFLENVTKYRKKLLPGSNERSLLLVYSDCTLAQVYARLGLLNSSKIHFHQALHQIKYDQMHLSNTDFRLKRSLLKLIETQLLHWYYREEQEEDTTQDYFLLNYLDEFKNDKFISWNKSRFFIYQAYYDRLINDYRRQKCFPIANDFNWEIILCEAEKDAIKLDLEWIKCLRNAWIHPVSEQISLQGSYSTYIEQRRGSKLSIKPNNRYFIRSSLSHMKISLTNDMKIKNDDDVKSITIDNYSRQKFVNSRSISYKNNASRFPLYILPVRV